MEVTVEDFERQLEWLADNREVVDLQTAVDRWTDRDSERLVVVTFDDGYRDTFETAFPRLERRGMPFVLYLTTESVETGQSLGPGAGAEPLSWTMIESMMSSGLLTIGAHTHTHLDLRDATSSQAEHEIATSNAVISSRLGIDPLHFAYPWGYWSEEADPIVKAHYSTAVLGGSARPQSEPSKHQIHRYPVQLSDGVVFFRSRTKGGLLLEEAVRRRLRGYSGP
jgi:peptidoglycan/xylan/chitin deacetylase (PgdA/CDA1 family)